MTYTRQDSAVPTLRKGEAAYLVMEGDHLIAVVAGRAGAWVAGRVSPLREPLFGGFGYGRTREQAVAGMTR